LPRGKGERKRRGERKHMIFHHKESGRGVWFFIETGGEGGWVKLVRANNRAK